MKSRKPIAIFGIALLFLSTNLTGADKIRVVSTFSDFESIVKEIAGDLVEIDHLSHGDQDPHFVPPKPAWH